MEEKLIERLRAVPSDAMAEHGGKLIPYGILCQAAAHANEELMASRKEAREEAYKIPGLMARLEIANERIQQLEVRWATR